MNKEEIIAKLKEVKSANDILALAKENDNDIKEEKAFRADEFELRAFRQRP